MPVEFEGRQWDRDAVFEKLRPQITSERLQRIETVLDKRRSDLSLVVENIYNRGNTSAVMRSLEAFGYYQIHHIQLQDEFKESNRVTQGADKWLVQKSWESTKSCVEGLRAKGLKIFVTTLDGGRPIQDFDFSEPSALCFGNEKDGASKDLLDAADERVFVPMHGFVQSFNISVAAALCLQHIRGRQDAQGPSPLSEAERLDLEALYLLRSLKNPYQFLQPLNL